MNHMPEMPPLLFFLQKKHLLNNFQPRKKHVRTILHNTCSGNCARGKPQKTVTKLAKSGIIPEQMIRSELEQLGWVTLGRSAFGRQRF